MIEYIRLPWANSKIFFQFSDREDIGILIEGFGVNCDHRDAVEK